MPQLTTPLAKAVRTLEGWLVILTNAGLVIGTSVDPHALPPTEAGILASVLTGLHLASRTLLKLFAAQGTVGVGAPIQVSAKVANTVGDVTRAVEQVEKVAPAVVKQVETIAADVKAPSSAQVEREAAPAPEPPAPTVEPPAAAADPPAVVDPPPAAV